MRSRLPIAAVFAVALSVTPAAVPHAFAQAPDYLERAAAERERARDADAHDRAPLTYAQADGTYSRAQEAHAAHPDSPEPARTLAEEAIREYRHATHLALLADSIRDRKVTPEQILLRHESRLAELGEVLAFTPDFAEGHEAVAEQTLDAARRLQRDREDLIGRLEARDAEVARLEAMADSLQASLAEADRREAEMTARLAERERTKRRLREVRAVFDPDEAEVLVSDDRVTVRLAGLSFPSGSAELGPESAALLTKLQRVVQEFPGAAILVEGHTDDQGDPAANQALSRRRAIAVREYLLANLAMSADRISAIGYGSERPIAPNDSAAGRARNRRIDVTIDASGSG